jgi:hypothetical protein
MSARSQQSADTTSTSIQETITPSVSGLVTGDNFQGHTLNISGLTPSGLADAISGLINLSSHSLDIAAGAGEIAIDSVRQTAQETTSPNQASIEKIVPIVMIAVVGIIVWKVVK